MATGLESSYYYDFDPSEAVQQIIKDGDDDVWWSAVAANQAHGYAPLLCIFVGFFCIASGATNLTPALKHVGDLHVT